MVNRPVFPPFVFTYHNNAPKAPTAKGVAISITIVGLKVSILLQMTSFLDKLNGKVMLFGQRRLLDRIGSSSHVHGYGPVWSELTALAKEQAI